MIAVTLRGLFNRKLRTLLTMIAIVLGVSMISGTYVLTDTINSSFTSIFQQAYRRTDAVISGKSIITGRNGLPPPLPASLLSVVQGTPGVVAAEGEIADEAQLFTLNGKAIGSASGAPTLLFSVPEPRFRAETIVRGHEPVGNEVAVDETTASRFHLRLGQVLRVAGSGQAQRYRLVGITRFGSVGSIGGATLASMDLATAQRFAGKEGKYDQIVVAGASNVSHAALVRAIRARLPAALRSRVQVKTSEQSAADQTKAIGNALNFLTIALLAFGGIAVFVGAFIIFNTFSITVAQRTREFALLRTLGASRGQILRSVISEAVLVGFVASVLGLFAGFGIARGLNALFVAFGVDLPNSGLIVQTRTVVVALLVGTVVTLAAGVMPAVRATRVPPIAALREGAQLPRSRWARFTPYIATALTLLGVLALAVGIFASISATGQRLSLIGLGAILLFIGVAMLSPKFIAPMAAVIGWPMERFSAVTGRLARENAVRNPSRTAVTAAALMIGLALVGFVTIFAAELTKTANDAVDRELIGTYAIYGQQRGIPAGVSVAVAHVPGVQTVSVLGNDAGRIKGIGTVDVGGIEPQTIRTVYHFQWTQGSDQRLLALSAHQGLISDTFATDHHLGLGSILQVTTPTGAHDTFSVAGVYKSSQLLSDVQVPYSTFAHDWATHQVRYVVVEAASGANLAAVQARIAAVLQRQYPTAQVHSQADIKAQQSKGINQLLALIYVLLAMSVLVSLFGIINTLILSVFERTREIGMLRAIGTTRRQVRWIIRWESVITAVIGAILGLLLGIVLAVLITAGLRSQGIEYALPIGRLLIWVIFAILFGIVAAAFPARHAARLDVLRAVAYE